MNILPILNDYLREIEIETWLNVYSLNRIQQRNGRKTLTTVQGLSSDYDLKKIVRACKKEFACNGTVVEHPEYGEVSETFVDL